MYGHTMRFVFVTALHIPYTCSQKYWQLENLVVWQPKPYVVILVEFKFGGLSTMAHRCLYIVNILAEFWLYGMLYNCTVDFVCVQTFAYCVSDCIALLRDSQFHRPSQDFAAVTLL